MSVRRYLPAAAIVGLEIPYPLVHGHARNVLTIVAVVAFAIASTCYAGHARGWRFAAILVAVAGVGGLGVEVLGVRTGVPFGDYRYTGGLGPCLAGVPIVVGLAWLMMSYPSLVVASRVFARPSARAVGVALSLAGWDVFLDPQMVSAGHWYWLHHSPHLPGIGEIPLSNFGGWLLVAVVIGALLVATSPPPRSDEKPAIALWLWVWLSSALAAAAFFGRPAVAGWGLLAMGLVGVPLVLRLAKR